MSSERESVDTTYGSYAGFVSRMLAFIIDRFITGLLTGTLAVFARYALDAFRMNEIIGTDQITRWIVIGISAVIAIFISYGYDIGFWMLAGQTPGKAVLGVRVVGTSGERIRFGRAFLRRIGYWLSAILLLGYFWILVDNRRQGFHDKLARTVVLYSWPEEDDKLKEMTLRERLRYRRESRNAVQNEPT